MLKPLTVWITTNCGKFLKRWKTRPPYLSPEKSIPGSSSNSWNRTWNTDLFKIGKRVRQGCMMSLCLFNFYAEYIMQNVRLDESQAGIKTVSKNINSLRYADDTTLVAESEEELKILLTRIKQESEKAGLKLNIQKTKIMASGPIQFSSVQFSSVTQSCLTLCDPMANRRGKSGSRDRFYFLGSKITVDHDCRQEIKRHLLLGRKPMTS